MPKKLINDPDNQIVELIEGMISAQLDKQTVEGKTGRPLLR